MRKLSVVLGILTWIVLPSQAQFLHRITDIQPGVGSSIPTHLSIYENKLFFVTSDTFNRRSVWSSTGPAAGTTLLKDFSGSFNNWGGFSIFNNRLFFGADDGFGAEPWTSDGTSGNTIQLKDIHPSSGSLSGNYAVLGNKVLFTADDSIHGPELWVSDGTQAGTQLVKDINPSLAGSDPGELIAFNGKVFFSANDGSNGRELWVTDGTTAGTSLFMNIHPTSYSNPGEFFASNNKLFFRAENGIGNNNSEPWISDGTTSGTHILKDIKTGSGSFPIGFSSYNGVVYFSAAGDGAPAGQYNVYRTDGTDTGTHLLKLGSGYGMIGYGGKVYFGGQDNTHGAELWVTDGTMAGTQLLKDIRMGTNGSMCRQFTVFKNRIIFIADDGSNGWELWTSDGTSAGTYKPSFLNATHTSPLEMGTQLSGPAFKEFDGALYFGAEFDNHGVELYRLDSLVPTSTFLGAATAPVSREHLLRLHPNPSIAELTVHQQQSGILRICDLTGKVLVQTYQPSRATIDVSGLAPGLYILQDQYGAALRFIKQ